MTLQQVYINVDKEMLEEHPMKVCMKGCFYCCYQKIGVYKLELLNISKYDLRSKVKNMERKHPCPFLSDGKCTIYNIRPFACRSYQSCSRNACIYRFEHEEEISKDKKITDKQMKDIGCYDDKLFPKRYYTKAEVEWIKLNGKNMYCIQDFYKEDR